MSCSPPFCSCDSGLGFFSCRKEPLACYFTSPFSTLFSFSWSGMIRTWCGGHAESLTDDSLLSGPPAPHSLCPLQGREVIVFIMCLSRLSYLFLKSTSLLLKSCCSEIIDDIHHSPVCRIGWSPILHGTAKHISRQSSRQIMKECAARLTTQTPRVGPGQFTGTMALSSLRGPDLGTSPSGP